MRDRFVILVDRNGVDADRRDGLTAFLRSKGWQIWHWLDDSWLVVRDVEVQIEAKDLYHEIDEFLDSNGIFLVIPAGKDAAGRVNMRALPWLMENWA